MDEATVATPTHTRKITIMKHHSLSRTRVALGIGALLLAGCNDNDSTPKPAQPTLGHRTVSLIEQDGLQFKDLDGSGALTPL